MMALVHKSTLALALHCPARPRVHASNHIRHHDMSDVAPQACLRLRHARTSPCCRKHRSVKCHAEPEGVMYQGMYGPWSIEQEDIIEVLSYRAGLTVATAAFVGIALISSTLDSSTGSSPAVSALNPISALGAAALGLSLVQIHIYVTPIKRAIQVLWALGVLGGCYLAITHPEQPLPLLVAHQPWSVWFVGPAAAAVTGVAIKEGLCYGKPEAAALALLLPVLCLSHLSGIVPEGFQGALLVAVCGVSCVFAGRKYSQAIKDDIGDKSVFMFRKLPEAEQQRLLQHSTLIHRQQQQQQVQE